MECGDEEEDAGYSRCARTCRRCVDEKINTCQLHQTDRDVSRQQTKSKSKSTAGRSLCLAAMLLLTTATLCACAIVSERWFAESIDRMRLVVRGGRRRLEQNETMPEHPHKRCASPTGNDGLRRQRRNLQNVFPDEEEDFSDGAPDPDCDDRRHFYWLPKESPAPSTAPSSTPSRPPQTLQPSAGKKSLNPVTQYPSIPPSVIPTGTPEPSESFMPSQSMEPSVSNQPTEEPTIHKGIDSGRGVKITNAPTIMMAEKISAGMRAA